MKFKKEDLLNALYESPEKLKEISDEIIGHSRWSVIHEFIFQEVATGKFYRIEYSRGATEYQDEGAWQYEDDEIECEEVVPVEKTVTVYVKV